MSGLLEASSGRYRIGYAMTPKKAKTIFQDSLIDFASERGIEIIPIDLHEPLVGQQSRRPFDAIIHKLYCKDWRKQLHEFSARYPSVPIIDPLDNTEKLHNRGTMLEVVNSLTLPPHGRHESIGIPKQVFVVENENRVGSEELKFPVIAKPMLANGTDCSHQMCLVFNKDGLNDLKLETPFVLQEFVNHGGVVFKVYVAGDHVRCVKRRSLPDISEEKLKDASQNLLPFKQISNLACQDQSDDSVVKLIEDAVMPPSGFVNEMACALREALKLHLFNFDIIRDSANANRYLVIDINYFPGYFKLPCYGTMLTDFFVDIVQQHKQVTDSSVKQDSG